MSAPYWLNEANFTLAETGGDEFFIPVSTLAFNSKAMTVVKTMVSVINFDNDVNYAAMSNLPSYITNSTSNTGTPNLLFWLTPLSNNLYNSSAQYLIKTTTSSNAAKGPNFGVETFYLDLASYTPNATSTWYLWASNVGVGTFTAATNFSYGGLTTVRDGDANTISINGGYSSSQSPMLIYGKYTGPPS